MIRYSPYAVMFIAEDPVDTIVVVGLRSQESRPDLLSVREHLRATSRVLGHRSDPLHRGSDKVLH